MLCSRNPTPNREHSGYEPQYARDSVHIQKAEWLSRQSDLEVLSLYTHSERVPNGQLLHPANGNTTKTQPDHKHETQILRSQSQKKVNLPSGETLA